VLSAVPPELFEAWARPEIWPIRKASLVLPGETIGERRNSFCYGRIYSAGPPRSSSELQQN